MQVAVSEYVAPLAILSIGEYSVDIARPVNPPSINTY